MILNKAVDDETNKKPCNLNNCNVIVALRVSFLVQLFKKLHYGFLQVSSIIEPNNRIIAADGENVMLFLII